MTTEKVDWEYMRGVPALRHLINMLGTALAEAIPDEAIERTAGWNWVGYYIGKDKKWIGVRYENPMVVSFETGPLKQLKPYRTLDLQNSHFFAFEAGEQLEILITFVSDASKELGLLVPSPN